MKMICPLRNLRVSVPEDRICKTTTYIFMVLKGLVISPGPPVKIRALLTLLRDCIRWVHQAITEALAVVVASASVVD